ncbi:MAG: poly-gamma-glutamate synthase PgsB [Longimicrobiaceae bacterium]
MTEGLAGLVFLVLVGLAVAIYWRRVLAGHERRLEQLEVCVHVNGIRGKSSVTRLVAGLLREGGFVTVAKTTGSAARVIGPRGEESKIFRRGAATINEQVDIVEEHVGPGVEALVIECMAVKPLYQQYSQEFMVKSDITIITNVREDHQEEMGETLEQIADSMSVTIPRGGVLITAEERPHLRERLRRNARRRDCRFVYANPAWVSDEDMRGFDYLQFKSNVAIGLAVARILGIDGDAAIRGMWKSVPDIGVVRLFHYDIRGKNILWVPLFAANDRESVVLTFEVLQAYYPEDATVIGILNNRWDRGRRAELFARLVPLDLSSYLDHVITFGGYEEQVTQIMTELGYPRERITNLGESVHPTLDQILDTIASLVEGEQGVLIGLVNIHTHQAEMLMEYFDHARGTNHGDAELDLSRDPARMPLGVQRLRRAAARPPRDLSGPNDWQGA